MYLRFLALTVCLLTAIWSVDARCGEYSISCDQAERWYQRTNGLTKRSEVNPYTWYVNDRLWYSMKDSTKEFEVAHIFKYSECHAKDNEKVAIKVISGMDTVAKTDYSGRVFILRVMP